VSVTSVDRSSLADLRRLSADRPRPLYAPNAITTDKSAIDSRILIALSRRTARDFNGGGAHKRPSHGLIKLRFPVIVYFRSRLRLVNNFREISTLLRRRSGEAQNNRLMGKFGIFFSYIIYGGAFIQRDLAKEGSGLVCF
jgi:hypothetical protein